jgi:glycosyltransferase involved in cell wall biosynthesis
MAKILIIANSLSPLTRERGLVGQADGHQIYWFSNPKVNLPNVIALGPPTWGGHLFRYLLDPVALMLTIHSIQPDLIHVHYADQGRRTPFLLHHHPLVVSTMGGDILPDQLCHGFSALRVRTLLNRADCITSKSEFLDMALARIGNYQGKVKRVTWGVDLKQFNPDREVTYLRTKWDIPSSDLVFFDPRSLRPLYNKHIILEAFANYLHAGGPSATLIIAEFLAEPSYAARLRRQARDLGISDRVRYVGMIERAHMPDYYVLADATISIPSSDGLPHTTYEALACGSFLILGDLPQYNGIVEEAVTARLVPPRDANAVAEAMAWVAARPELRARVGQVGRAYVQKYADRRTQTQLVNQIYAELLDRYKRS